MRNVIPSALFAASILALSSPAFAQGLTYQFYVGGDYQDVSPSYKSGLSAIAPNLSQGIDIHGGVRFGRYYALEAGFLSATGDRDVIISSVPISTKVNVSGGTLDAYGFLPIAHGPFSLFATGGISYLDGEATVSSTSTSVFGGKSEFGYRGGGGMQFEIGDLGNFRLTARYQSASFSGVASGAFVYGLGLNIYI